MGASTSDPTTARRRPSRCRIRLAAVIVLWTIAIEVSLWAVAEGAWGPVVFYVGGDHGVHEGDVVVIGGSTAVATILSVVLLWPCARRRPGLTGATERGS